MLSYAPAASHPRLVIAAGIRTPMAKAGGRFAKEDAGHLGALVARELLARTGVPAEAIDEVVTGCVGPPFDEANVSRVIALRAGLPRATSARTVARNCASGIEAVTTAATNILAGMGDTYLCLGVEVMSSYPLIFGQDMTNFFARLNRARSLPAKLKALAAFRPRMLAPRVSLVEGLTDPTTGLIMGRTAELIARDFGLTREACDAFALNSHLRAKAARDRGRFDAEILPVMPLGSKPGAKSLRQDDGIRDDQSLEALAKMKPYFEKPDGIVTVANSCGITDAACALLITTEAKAKALGLEPLAAIKSFAWAGLDPARMGLGPVFSTAAALDAAGLRLADMATIELNEAFAAQVLGCEKAFASQAFAREHLNRDQAVGELDPAKLNPNGGAIALGHPVGCTGARLLLTTALELKQRDAQFGLATLCIGGGQGGAVILENLN